MNFKSQQFIFLILGLFFGLVMIFLTPPQMVPDEVAHVMRACEVSEGGFYNKTPPQSNNCYQKFVVDGIMPKVNVNEFHGASGYFPMNYFSSAIALKIFGNVDSGVRFYVGRIFNLFVWLAIIYFAIKITPVFKNQFLLCALLPMSLYMGMSYSADSWSNALAFLFFAFLFRLIYGDNKVSIKDVFTFSVFSFVGALCKGVVYPILLLLLVPFKCRSLKFVITFVVLFIAMGMAFAWQSINYSVVGYDVNPYINKLYIIHNPLSFLLLLIYCRFVYSLSLYLGNDISGLYSNWIVFWTGLSQIDSSLKSFKISQRESLHSPCGLPQ